jgi:hypothetical protein
MIYGIVSSGIGLRSSDSWTRVEHRQAYILVISPKWPIIATALVNLQLVRRYLIRHNKSRTIRSLHDTMWNTDAHASYSKRQEKASTHMYLDFGAQERGARRRFRLRHSAGGSKNRIKIPAGFRGFPPRHPSTI